MHIQDRLVVGTTISERADDGERHEDGEPEGGKNEGASDPGQRNQELEPKTSQDIAAPFTRLQHNPSALDHQVDIALPAHELLKLAQQAALNLETTWAWSAWHAMSIDLTLRLFPTPGSNFGSAVLVHRRHIPKIQIHNFC